MILGALALIGGAIGLVKGAVNAYAKNEQYNERRRELQEAQSNLTAQYNDTIANLAADVEEANQKLEANIADVTLSRDIGARASAQGLADQQTLANMQIAELQIQAREAQGSAVQNVAMSGVRRMTDAEGNVVNAPVFRTTQAANRSISQAQAQTAVSLRQNFEQAKQNYLSSNMNIEAYRRELAFNGTVTRDANGNIVGGTGKMGRQYNSYKLRYDQQYSANQRDLDYMNGTGQTLFNISTYLGVVGDMFSGITGGVNFFNSFGSYSSYEYQPEA